MRNLFWPLIILASAALIAVYLLEDLQNPLRPWLAFWFLLICPGMAFVPLLRINNWMSELVIALSLSIAIDTIVATIAVLTKVWSPEIMLTILIGICFLGIATQFGFYFWRGSQKRGTT